MSLTDETSTDESNALQIPAAWKSSEFLDFHFIFAVIVDKDLINIYFKLIAGLPDEISLKVSIVSLYSSVTWYLRHYSAPSNYAAFVELCSRRRSECHSCRAFYKVVSICSLRQENLRTRTFIMRFVDFLPESSALID